MLSRSRGLIALAAVAGALAAAAPAAAGPPWISIEYPSNPFDPATRGATLMLHAYHHGDPMSVVPRGTAEGLVGGQRRSIALRITPTSRPGVYAVRAPDRAAGAWVLVISFDQSPDDAATALVSLGNDGQVLSVRVPSDLRDGWVIPRAPTSAEIDEQLRTTERLAAAFAGTAGPSGRVAGAAATPVGLLLLAGLWRTLRRHTADSR